ncbi:OmpA family protein [Vibrio nomapromontoriensis]|uniref:OmpA family protein n=1 Tax=Vibrio nomapromontoriensis TaxID=2910246 RepID=UPI003D0CC1F9
MKKIACLIAVGLLAGCSSTSSITDKMFAGMLDTAPRSEHDVMHPEWVNAPHISHSGQMGATVEGPNGQYRTQAWDSLETYLVNHGLDYELVPGDYVMIRLKEKIHFSTGSSRVSDNSSQWLFHLANFLSQQQGIDVVIGGHTDNTGAIVRNDVLSDKRAEMVKETLIKNQVSRQIIYTRGYGEAVPACTNSTSFGKACNRRVELTLIVAK